MRTASRVCVLTCAGHGGGVLLGPEEALLAEALDSPLPVAEAMWGALGALDVPRERLVEARATRYG